MSLATNSTDLARADVRALPLYTPDEGTCSVDVSDNTNLWGMPPAAAKALREVSPADVARYPSLYGSTLKESILRSLGIDAAVVTGCGSDEVLDLVMRA